MAFGDRSVELVLSDVSARLDLHDLIADALDFPDYYGQNWDAFDECARNSLGNLPSEIRIVGFDTLAKQIPREARLLRSCFSELATEDRIVVHWAPSA